MHILLKIRHVCFVTATLNARKCRTQMRSWLYLRTLLRLPTIPPLTTRHGTWENIRMMEPVMLQFIRSTMHPKFCAY